MFTRRALIARAGATSVGAFLTGRGIAAPSISPTMATLSAYMSEAASRPIPADVIEKGKHHILDTVAAMVSGSELAPGQFAIRYARARPGDKIATVAASDVVCGSIEAAFAN